MRAQEIAGVEGMEKPYEQVKELMRGHSISRQDVEDFISSRNFDAQTANRLKNLTPESYTGIASRLVDFIQ